MHTTLIAIDIIGFGTRCRDTHTQRHVRHEMYERLSEAFAMTNLPWATCHHEDRGDGALIVMPSEVDVIYCLDPLAHHLAVVLRDHNRLAGDATRLRLRAAIHHGYVERDAYGVISPAVLQLFRLLEARSFKKTLQAADTDLGVIVSDTLYTEALQRGSGLIDPSSYQRLSVSSKETKRIRAWLWLPQNHADHH